MNRMLSVITGLAAGAVLCTAAFAQSPYIWKDDNGRTVYSDTPPPPSIPKARIVKGAAPAKAAPAAAPVVGADGKEVPKDGTAAAATVASNDAAKAPAKDAKTADTGPKTLAERDAESKKRNAEAAEKSKKAEEKAAADKQNSERCNELRNQVTALESGQRMNRTNDKGEREAIDDSQRQQMISRSRDDIAKNCK
jgi:hypothetical protein